jgi:hypothetical protein
MLAEAACGIIPKYICPVKDGLSASSGIDPESANPSVVVFLKKYK